MGVMIDLTGRVFGRWTVLGLSEKRGVGKDRVFWDCRCTCGTERPVSRRKLARGRSRSCGGRGCFPPPVPGAASGWKPYTRDDLLAVVRREYQSSARARNLPWGLSDEEFTGLLLAPCAYCGSAPSRVFSRRGGKDSVTIGGVDRLDNSRGYDPANCAPCCKICNGSKSDYPLGVWQDWLRRVAAHQATTQPPTPGTSSSTPAPTPGA